MEPIHKFPGPSGVLWKPTGHSLDWWFPLYVSGGDGEYQGYSSDFKDYLTSFYPLVLVQNCGNGLYLILLPTTTRYVGYTLLGVSSRISSSCTLPRRLYLCRSASSSFTGALLLTSFYVTKVSTDAKSVFFTIDSRLQTLGG